MKLDWLKNRKFDTGVDQGVLYIGGNSVPWNGLISVTEKIPGGEITQTYLNGIKYRDLVANEDFALTLNAYTYPDEFNAADGLGDFADYQVRQRFGLSYRVIHGDGYKIHLVYNCLAENSEKMFNSIDDNAQISNFSWDISAAPILVPGAKPSAHFIIDTELADPRSIEAISDIIYGTDDDDARLPTAEEVIAIFDAYPGLIVTDNGDGTFTITGPDSAFVFPDADSFEITWPSIIYLSADTWQATTF